MVNYFSHDMFARNDKRLQRLFMLYNSMEPIGVFWCLVEMLYEEGGYIELSECDRIAFELRTSIDLIKHIIFDSLLFENDDTRFWSNSALRRIQLRIEKSNKAKSSVEKRWNKDRYTDVLPSNDDSNTIKQKKNKINKNTTINGCGIIDNPPDNNTKRNLPALNRRLLAYNASISDIEEIYQLSNFGAIGSDIWKIFEIVDGSNGQIKMPIRYIISRMKAN
jgi:hypothetical protein